MLVEWGKSVVRLGIYHVATRASAGEKHVGRDLTNDVANE